VTDWLTTSLNKNRYCETYSFFGSQEILINETWIIIAVYTSSGHFFLFWSRQIKSTSSLTILSVYFNIFIPSTSRSSKLSPPPSFLYQNLFREKFIARGNFELELLLEYKETQPGETSKYRRLDDKGNPTPDSSIARNKDELQPLLKYWVDAFPRKYETHDSSALLGCEHTNYPQCFLCRHRQLYLGCFVLITFINNKCK
jgi:hypothetical protein